MVRVSFVCLSLLALAACAPGDAPVIAGAPDAGTAQAVLPPPGTALTAAPQSQAAAQVASADPSVSGILCPQVQVRSGTETLRSYEKGTSGADADLKYQANLTSLSRECSLLGLEVGLKVVARGRVILGPKGKPGTYKLPVRVAVVRGTKPPLWSKVINVDAKVAAGSAAADFVVTAEDILFPRDATDTLSDLQIFAGFDPGKK